MIPNLHPYPQHKESDGSTPTTLRPPAQHPALWVHGLQVIGFVEVAGAATQRPVRPLVLAAPARRHDVFDFKGEIEDGLRGAAVFATMPGSLRHRWVAGIHYLKSASRAAARSPEAWTSASTKASNSACSAGGSDLLASQATRQRAINSLSRCCCRALKDWSGRWLWTMTSVPASSAGNCAVMASKAAPAVLARAWRPPPMARYSISPWVVGSGKMATFIMSGLANGGLLAVLSQNAAQCADFLDRG